MHSCTNHQLLLENNFRKLLALFIKLLKKGSIGVLFIPLLGVAHQKDTIDCHFNSTTPTLYTDTSGGYMFGTNGLEDQAFAQKFGVDTAHYGCHAIDSSMLSEVLIWAGGRHIVGDSDTVQVHIYSINSNGKPGKRLSSSYKKNVDQLDTSTTQRQYTRFLLKSPVEVTDSFFVIIDLKQIVDDTVGLMTTQAGDGGGNQTAWVRDSSGVWKSVKAAGKYEVNLGLFPVLEIQEDVHSGVDEYSRTATPFICSPVPADHYLKINYSNISSPLSATSRFTIELINNNGRGIKKASVTIDDLKRGVRWSVSSLPAGIYYIRIYDHNRFLMQKEVIVTHP